MKPHTELTSFDGYQLLNVEPESSQLTIVPIGDLHLGSPHFRRAFFLAGLDWIVKRDAYIILTGDLLECGTKGSVGAGVYEQVMSPSDQIEAVVKLLDPVKDRILGAVKGNHEERLHKDAGSEAYLNSICPRLGIPYFGWEAFILFSLPHYKSILTYTCHTKAGGKNANIALNWMTRELVKVVDADIYFKSHDHSMGWYPEDTLDVNRVTQRMEMRERHFFLTGNWIGRADSYAAASACGHKPAGTVAAEIDLRTGKVKPVYYR